MRHHTSTSDRLVIWFAQGFGIGRVPFAPGTFGSLLGLGWFALLVALPNGWFYLAGIVVGTALSVAVCGKAERALGQKDPGSIVLDEIAAMPICFAAWAVALFVERGSWPRVFDFFNRETWFWSLGIFAAFRLFDVLKPWPIRQSQSLAGGWGVTADDFLAAAYVNACAMLAFFWLA